MNETTPAGGPSPRGSWPLLLLVLLALSPSAYLLITGRQQRTEMAAQTAAAETVALALADSLDAARTQLLVDRVLVLAGAGQTDQATELASRFFDRVDKRSRVPTAPFNETETRFRVLALRDQTIAALTLRDPSALQLIEEIATLHLPLGDPTLGARIPTTVPETLPAPEDTVHEALPAPGDTVPEALPAPEDTVPRSPDSGRVVGTLGSR